MFRAWLITTKQQRSTPATDPMQYRLVEDDTGKEFGPASYEAVEKYNKALTNGQDHFLYEYCGYKLKMKVVLTATVERQKSKYC